MPTTYTHYAYGQEVFHKLPEELQRKIEPYIEYYNIGVQVRIFCFIIILIAKIK